MDGRLARLAVAAAALATGGALAADPSSAPRGYLQLDNDLFLDSDRWYSSGVRLSRATGPIAEETEWGLLQEIYTPEVRFYEPGRVDRAPAARLLLFAARHHRSDRRLQTLELGVGVRGPSAQGERSADAVHAIVGARDIYWYRQEGDRLDAQLVAARTEALGAWRVNYGAVVGTQLVFGHASLEWRFGSDGAVPAASPAMRFASTPATRPGEGWAGFVGAGVRGVARDRLLDRGYGEAGPPPTAERWIARFAAGITRGFSWGAVAFALVQDTREFREQRRLHRFGSLTMQLPF